MGWLIPLLIFFIIIGGVLMAALVHQLRNLEAPSDQSAGW